MDVSYWIQGIEFEWDEDKAFANIDKHGITFEEATEAFFDPFYQHGEASRQGEHRDFLIGYTLTEQLLVVIFLERGSRTRIVSAREATRQERKLYEDG